MYTYEYPRPALTADIVVFGFDGRELQVLLIERKLEPYQGLWALPGGFMHQDETLEECAMRELYEETHFRATFLQQVRAHSAVARDPRGRVVTVSFFCLMPISEVQAGTDASQAQWFSLSQLPPLAFDHKEILNAAKEQMRREVYFQPIAFNLLDNHFTMPELQHVYEKILDTTFDRRNFQKKMLASGIVTPVGTTATTRRPAILYSFLSQQYQSLKQSNTTQTEF